MLRLLTVSDGRVEEEDHGDLRVHLVDACGVSHSVVEEVKLE